MRYPTKSSTRRAFTISRTVTTMVFATAVFLPGVIATTQYSADKATKEAILDILETIDNKANHVGAHDEDRPFVSLCFAQSLDGKLAMYTDNASADSSSSSGGAETTVTKKTTSNLAISGPSSLLMTHALRSAHDAILVGGRTLAIDNPRLSNRLWLSSHSANQPRPVVLDPYLVHLQALSNRRRARHVIVCYADSVDHKTLTADYVNDVTFLPCRTTKDGHLDLTDVLVKLKRRHRIQRLMVEGGPSVLGMFVKANFFDCLCVTVAPKIFGDGLSILEPCDLSTGDVRLHRFDNDICLLAFPPFQKP